MTKTYYELFEFLNFGNWNLFDIWNLVFGVLENDNYRKTNPLRG